MLDVKIKRLDKSLPLPLYHTKNSVAFDLYARKKTILEPGEMKLIPANVIIEVPQGYMLLLASRSSTPFKYQLLMPHGVGIIDQDYCGPSDELKIQLYNFGSKKVLIQKGERLAQGIFVKIEKASFQEVKSLRKKSRGGFGSTGP